MDALLAAARADLPGATAVGVGTLALLGGNEWAARRFRPAPETSRKIAHAGAGLLCLSFPWVVSSAWTVAVLAGGFFGLLALGARTGWLQSVHGVGRRSAGAWIYPFAVWACFWAADGDALRYGAPLMVLAIADAGAAIVGRRAGARRYDVMDGARSLEGSLGFFGLAFAVLLTAAALAGRPGWPAALVVAFTAATVATLVESISVRGADNLLVPFAVLFVLDLGLRGGGGALEPLLWGLAGSGVLAYAAVQRGQATVSGALAVTLVGGTAWALGGPPVAVPLFAAWALLRVRGGERPADLDEVFPTAAGALVLLLVAASGGGTALRGPTLAALAASGAIALARPARRPVAAAALGAGLPLLAAAALGEDLPYWRIGVLSLAGPLAFALLSRSAWWGRRLVASLLAAALAWSFA